MGHSYESEATMPNPIEMTDTDFANWIASEDAPSIGGSDIGSIIGVSHFGTPASVWDTIMRQVPRAADNPNMSRGRALEPHASLMYQAATGRSVANCPTFWSERDPYFRYSPDRIIATSPGHDGLGILEIKVPGSHNWSETRLRGVDPSYYAQLQWYMGGARKSWGSFYIFNADRWEGFHVDVNFDQDYFTRLEDAGTNFWQQYVLTRVRPPEPSTEEIVATPRVGGEAISLETLGADGQWANLLQRLQQTQERKRLAEHEYELAAENIKTQMQQLGPDVDVITGFGATIRWNAVPQHRFDIDRFKREHPDIAAEYVRVINSRPFRVNFGRET